MEPDYLVHQVTIAQFKKLRDELVARLGWQQNLVRYSLIVAAALPALASTAVRDFIGPDRLPFALLMGPILSLFILGSMMKHQLYVNLLADYISGRLGQDVPFRGWLAFQWDRIYGSWRRRIFYSILLGSWDFMVPVLVASLYLLLSWVAADKTLPTAEARLAFSILFYGEILLLVLAFCMLAGLYVAIARGSLRWNRDARRPPLLPVRPPWRIIIHEAAQALLSRPGRDRFSPSDVYHEVLKTHPGFNRGTNNAQVLAGCVNCRSRTNYPGRKPDYYFRLQPGVYRLYDPERDGLWDQEGNQVEQPTAPRAR